MSESQVELTLLSDSVCYMAIIRLGVKCAHLRLALFVDTLSIASRPNASWVCVAGELACTMELMALRQDASTPEKPKSGSRSFLSLICTLRLSA